MKEKLYTIPLNDAVNTNDECPFCFIERKVEQDLMDFVLGNGSSYMESDIRDKTDHAGFCRMHFKKMYDYGNTLGNAWILKTHMKQVGSELKNTIDHYKPSSSNGTLFIKRKSVTNSDNTVTSFIRQKEESCFICNQYKEHFNRYLDTFLQLYLKDEDFNRKIREGKGFCLPHLGDLCEYAEVHLNDKQKAAFFPSIFALMECNMNRLYNDISWMIEKFDYRNKDADWKNSREAIQNCMQKLKGGYPADPEYKMKK